MVIMTEEPDQESSFSGDDEYSGEDENQTDASVKKINLGWADSVSKVLHLNKPKGKKSLVLSKAKKISDLKRKSTQKEIDPGFEIEGELKEEKKEEIEIKDESITQPETKKRKKKKDILSLRIKPNILDKERERAFAKIATRGVVQLFNAVQMQQKNITTKLEKAGPLERKQEQVLKNIDKRSFLDVLMGNSKSEDVNNIMEKKENKIEITKSKDNNEVSSQENGPTWNVLKDDFMVNARLKDWDKRLTDDDESENNEDSNDSE